MADANTTRRRMVGAIALAPLAGLIASVPTVAARSAAGADTPLLEMWKLRQTSLAAIEQRGSFYYSEWHSPAETEAFDMAETAVGRMIAHTPAGVMAKLWVALSHTGASFGDRPQEREIIRRADLADVKAIAGDFDYDQTVIFSAIQSLAAMTEGRDHG